MLWVHGSAPGVTVGGGQGGPECPLPQQRRICQKSGKREKVGKEGNNQSQEKEEQTAAGKGKKSGRFFHFASPDSRAGYTRARLFEPML